MRLREYCVNDADTIVSWILNEKSFYQWSADRINIYPCGGSQLNEHYENYIGGADGFRVMCAMDGDELVGQLLLRYLDEEHKHVRFGFIIVDPNKRGKGYGKKMLAEAKKYAKSVMQADKVSLGVFINNESAMNCYNACGLVATGEKHTLNLMNEQWECITMEEEL